MRTSFQVWHRFPPSMSQLTAFYCLRKIAIKALGVLLPASEKLLAMEARKSNKY